MDSRPRDDVARMWILAAAVALGTAACGPPHITAFTPRERNFVAGRYAEDEPGAKPTAGSLFSDAKTGLFQDPLAGHVGDILSIKIDESADAQGDSTTSLSRKSSMSAGVDTFFGLVTALKSAGIDPTKLAELSTSSSFDGSGATARKGQLSGDLTVRVRKEMPNGDLFVEGTKVVLINNEEYHLYISGLVRRTDITRENTVLSSRVADAQIEFTGRGDIADQNRKGWLLRLIDFLNPF